MSNTGSYRQKISANIATNANKGISAAKLRDALEEGAGAIDKIFETFNLADGLGTYNATSGIATIKETGSTFTPVTAANQVNGKYFDIIVAGSQDIFGTGLPLSLLIGGKIISRGTKWDYIPPSDAAYTLATSIKATEVDPLSDQVFNGGIFSLGSDANTFVSVLGTAGIRGNNETFKHEAFLGTISFWASREGAITIKLIGADLKIYFNQTFTAVLGLNTLVSGVNFLPQKIYKGGRIAFYVSTAVGAGSIGFTNPFGVGAFIMSGSNLANGSTVSLATPTPAYFALKVTYTVKKITSEIDDINNRASAQIDGTKLKNSYVLANAFNAADATLLSVINSAGVIGASSRYAVSGFIPVSQYADGAMISISEGRLGTVGFFYDASFALIPGSRIFGKSASDPIAEFAFPKVAGAIYLRANLDPQTIPLNKYMIALAPELPKNYLPYDSAPVNPKIVYPWLYQNPLPFPIDKLKGKRVHCEGDSTWIAPPSTYTTKPVWAYVAEWTGCTVTSSAISGSGMVKNSGAAANAQGFVDRAFGHWPANGTIDMLSLFIGMNDGAASFTLPDGTAYPNGLPLGTFADSTVYPEGAGTDLNLGSKKRLSVYGALHWLVQYAQYNYPLIPILLITSTPRGTTAAIQPVGQRNNWGKSGWYEAWAAAVKEIGAHYGVPVLDMYHESGMRPWNDAFNTQFMAAGDRIHPNTLLCEIYAQKVYQFWLRNI